MNDTEEGAAMSGGEALSASEKATLRYYEREAGTWSDGHSDPAFWAPAMSRLAAHLPPPARILEIGSGSGRDAEALIGRGYRYTGTDVSAALREIAARRVPGAQFLDRTPYALGFSEEFGGFWAAASLLHVPPQRMQAALRSLRSALRPGAVGFIALKPCAGAVTWQRDGQGRFFAYWPHGEFAGALSRAGFGILEHWLLPGGKHGGRGWSCYIAQKPQTDSTTGVGSPGR